MDQDPEGNRNILNRSRRIAINLSYLLILFIVANIAAGIILASLQKREGRVGDLYSASNFQKAYPEYKPNEIDSLLTETHERGFMYDPYLGYRELPFRGRYVNVSENGYRYNSKNQPEIEDSSVIPIFLFGGSTAFGYGVSDDKTIASYLDHRVKEINPVCCVYNFGAGGYFSNQEIIWFKQVLMRHKKPIMAIFIDGPNEFLIRGDEPLFADNIGRLLGSMHLYKEITDNRSFREKYLANLPLMKLYRKLIEPKTDHKPENTNISEIRQLMGRYRTNCLLENAIAGVFGIKTLFVMQPIPQYDYDLNYHVFKGDPILEDRFIKGGYTQMRVLCSDSALNWLWLGEIQHGIQKNLYVDNAHYNPDMNRMVADAIFRKLKSIIQTGDAQ